MIGLHCQILHSNTENCFNQAYILKHRVIIHPLYKSLTSPSLLLSQLIGICAFCAFNLPRKFQDQFWGHFNLIFDLSSHLLNYIASILVFNLHDFTQFNLRWVTIFLYSLSNAFRRFFKWKHHQEKWTDFLFWVQLAAVQTQTRGSSRKTVFHEASVPPFSKNGIALIRILRRWIKEYQVREA